MIRGTGGQGRAARKDRDRDVAKAWVGQRVVQDGDPSKAASSEGARGMERMSRLLFRLHDYPARQLQRRTEIVKEYFKPPPSPPKVA